MSRHLTCLLTGGNMFAFVVCLDINLRSAIGLLVTMVIGITIGNLIYNGVRQLWKEMKARRTASGSPPAEPAQPEGPAGPAE